jgi:hypothetical protein
MSRIILTKGVKEYRRTIPCCVTKQDTVLEIGCAWGTTSALLYQQGRSLVAIDKGASLPKAMEKYPYIHFEQIDGFDISRILSLGRSFTVVYIDISGCRDITEVLKMIRIYERVFSPRVIVVKSTKLKCFVDRCEAWKG